MTTIDAPIAATPPAAAVTPAYVRTAPAPSLAPPLTSVGWLGWARAHLFASAVSTVLTMLVVLLVVWMAPPVFDFLFVDAVWSGSDREACLPTPERPEVGACWAFIGDRFAVRDWSEQQTLAGAVVLDPDAARKGFHGEARLSWLERAAAAIEDLLEFVEVRIQADPALLLEHAAETPGRVECQPRIVAAHDDIPFACVCVIRSGDIDDPRFEPDRQVFIEAQAQIGFALRLLERAEGAHL